MDKALEDAKIEVAPTAKVWEAQRLYDKRLVNASSKEKGKLYTFTTFDVLLIRISILISGKT